MALKDHAAEARELLALRGRSAREDAGIFGRGEAPSAAADVDATPEWKRKLAEKFGEDPGALLEAAAKEATDLRGRAVGRNADDCDAIIAVLQKVQEKWGALEQACADAQSDAAAERAEAEDVRKKAEAELAGMETKVAARLKELRDSGEADDAIAKADAEAREQADKKLQEAKDATAKAKADAESHQMRAVGLQQKADAAAKRALEAEAERDALQAASNAHEEEMKQLEQRSAEELAEERRKGEELAAVVDALKARIDDLTAAAVSSSSAAATPEKGAAEGDASELPQEASAEAAAALQAELEEAKTEAATAAATVSTLRKQLHDAEKSLKRRELENEDLRTKLYLVVRRAPAPAVSEPAAAAPAPKARAPAPEESGMKCKLVGEPAVGATLRVVASRLPNDVTFQWFRAVKGGTEVDEFISGSNRPQYAPEPRDAGRLLGVIITVAETNETEMVMTPKPIASPGGLRERVQQLVTKKEGKFNVVIVQLNGEMQDRRIIYTLHVLPGKVKLKVGTKTRHKMDYHGLMQVCGARGGGDAAAQGLFLALSTDLVFMLACESARERNTAVMLIRRFSAQLGYDLCGPDDKQQDVAKTGEHPSDPPLSPARPAASSGA